MAAIRAADVNRIIARKGDPYRVVLVFGPDEGLVRLRANALASAFLDGEQDPLAKTEFEAEQLNADPPRLADEARSISMFGARRVIVVRQSGKLAKAIWTHLFEEPAAETLVVLVADDLGKSHALRHAAESSSKVAAIACYPPSEAEIRAVIETRFRDAGLSISHAAQSLLVEQLGADQALSEQEIDKLILYCRGQAGVEMEDIEAIVADSSAGSGSEPVDLAFDGELPAIEPAMSRCLRDGISGSAIISLALGHAQLLRRLQGLMHDGGLEAAIRQERIFFRRQQRVRRQAERWSEAGLERVLDTLAIAQAEGRMTSSLEETIAIRALWAVALAARRR